VVDWLAVLTKGLQAIKRRLENIKYPLFRFFERESTPACS
jgi:hypothetical protein